MIVSVYVDDLLLTRSDEESLRNFKFELMKLFEMTNLGLLSTYLSIQVIQEKGEILLNQIAFSKYLLEDQQMMDSNPSNSPLEQKIKVSASENLEGICTTVYRSILGKLYYGKPIASCFGKPIFPFQPYILEDLAILPLV